MSNRRPHRIGRFQLAVLALLLAAPQLPAQSAPPSPDEVLGYGIGEQFTPYAAVRDYSRALAEASPVVEYRPYGQTVEGRQLIQLLIARPENLARIDEILAANAELTRAGTSEARARQIAATNPAVVYFSYGVHGNESSSTEAAMWTAWDLARGAPEVAGVLDSAVVIIDPVVNPDGRDRYVQWYREVAGATPNPDPQTREHREPWPGGRYNHYLFDLNRDWAWMTQPETRQRLATWPVWNPQVHVDFHEMSPQSTYFFFPPSAPINPIYPPALHEWWRRFGEGNARAFDREGWAYFTRENYDMLYPGYGDSWPALLGTAAMTYEQAGGGSAGLAFERTAGDTLTLTDRATHHRTTGHATLRTAATGKTRLLLDFAQMNRTAGEGEPDVLLVPGPDSLRVRSLVSHLRRQGIEVERAGTPFRASSDAYAGYDERRDYPAGTYLVRMRQPHGRLAATLLQPETELRAEFSYDITAWSLPYAYGVEAHQTRSAPAAGWTRIAELPSPPSLASEPGYGYLLRPGIAASTGVAKVLAGGGAARVLTKATAFAGTQWPEGTWFLPVRGNPGLREAVQAAGIGALVVPVGTGMSDTGIDLGSANTPVVRFPRVALIGGDGVTPTSYGAHWYFYEQELGLPFDALVASELSRLDLARYDVVVLPDAAGRALGEAEREALEAWVRAGGRLVAVGGGAEIAAEIAEVQIRQEAQPDSSEGTSRFLRTRAEREREEWTGEVPGSILEVRIDPGHPLTWGASGDGAAGRAFVLHEGTRVFEPAADQEAAAYFGTDLESTSGVISAENLQRLQGGAWLTTKRVGRGTVVLFADDPLFRIFWRSMHPFYVNALLTSGL